MKIIILLSPLFISLLIYQSCGFSALTLEDNLSSELNEDFIDKDVPIDQRIAISKPRRLTNDEYDNSVLMLLGENSNPAKERFPQDVLPGSFDTNADKQSVIGIPSVQGYEELAREIAARFVGDSNRRSRFLGCSPSANDDATCFTQFINRFVKMAFSRTLTQEEVSTFVSFGQDLARKSDDFYEGIEGIVTAVLQMPEFLYLMPVGREINSIPGLYKLSGRELAKRLSLILISKLPDDELITAAENGELKTREGLILQAQRLLGQSDALDAIQRFHSIWLNYFELNVSPELVTDFQAETQQLIKTLLWDQDKPWTTLFSYNKTYINENLANHYGLPSPAGNYGWVNYNSGRSGILSHGAVLSSGVNFGDTSPVQRGKFILESLLCRELPDPPPDVDADEPPPEVGGDNCKEDRYKAYAPPGSSCFTCHSYIDPVGFGLEQFDMFGRHRTEEAENSNCKISGEGSLTPYGRYSGGSFNGPGELAALITTSGEVQSCMIKNLFEFSVGRSFSTEDRFIVDKLSQGFMSGDENFKDLLIEVVASPEFRYIRK